MPAGRDALRRLPRRALVDLAGRAGLQGRSRLTKEALVRILAERAAPAPLSWEEAPLPERVEEDRLILMAIDPYWIHAYWEQAPGAGGPPQAGPILRVYDVTPGGLDPVRAHSFFDIELTPDARNWYINVSSPGRSLCAELGRAQPDGAFLPRVRSNVIRTPPAGPSAQAEDRWERVKSRGGKPIFEPSTAAARAVSRRPRPAPPGAAPHDAAAPGASLTESVPPAPAAFRTSAGSAAVFRSPELLRAEADRRTLEGLRRARIFGTDGPTTPEDLRRSGAEQGGKAASASDHWIGKGEHRGKTQR